MASKRCISRQLLKGVDLQGLIDHVRALVALGVDAVVQDQNIDLRQIGIQAGFVGRSSSSPSGVGQSGCSAVWWSVGETDHVGACGTEATGQGRAQGSASACDADASTVERGTGPWGQLGASLKRSDQGPSTSCVRCCPTGSVRSLLRRCES